MKFFPKHYLAVVIAAACQPVFADPVFTKNMQTSDETLDANGIETLLVTAQKLDQARSQLMPETGSTVYRFDSSDIQALPLGDDTPINQVILQAPGVVQDSYGQLHVRGDHANLQYRINEVIIPEAMNGFGQSLDTRFADQINVLTGALPAQYGYRTAGIVDIHTKGVEFARTGDLSLVAGSNGHQEESADIGGATQNWNYFLSGSHLSDDMGIENPTAERNALHDHTNQTKSFGYLSRILDESSRVSFMFGTSNNSFQIPNVPGQIPTYSLAGTPAPDSTALNARQNENNQFEVLSYQASVNDKFNYQFSLFHRTTDVHYYPDPVGDLVFNGVAASIFRQAESAGIQADSSYKINDAHTIRAGFFIAHETFAANSSSVVFPVDAIGNVGEVPITIPDSTGLNGGTCGVYLQDGWQINPALTINYGARMDKTTTVTKEQQFSPRLGLVYDLSPETRIHAGYANYFTPPPTEIIGATSLEKFQNTTNALPTDVNTSVKAERSHYFDIGFTQKLSESWTAGVDAYYRRVKNLQDEGQFGSALIYSAFNYETARIGGLELTTSYQHEGFSTYINIAISKTMAKNIISGQYNFAADELDYINQHWIHLDHDQKLSGSAGASYKWDEVTFSGDLICGSGLRNGFSNTESLPAYTQINLSANKTFNTSLLGKLDLRIAATNIFDKVYIIRDGTGVGVGAPQYGPRRGVFVALNKQF